MIHPTSNPHLEEAMLESIEAYIELSYPGHEINAPALARQVFEQVERDVRASAPAYITRELRRPISLAAQRSQIEDMN